MNRATSIAKGQRIIGAARDEVGAMLKEKYEKGASIRALAASTGRSYGFVHRVLSEAGVTLRSRGGNARPRSAGGPVLRTCSRR